MNIIDSKLTLEELELIAEEIRRVLTKNNSLTLDQYNKIAETISLTELGYRKAKAICNEPCLEAYFPDEVFEKLKCRFSAKKVVYMNDDDKKFISVNRARGYRWLSGHMYTSLNAMSKLIARAGIKVIRQNHEYTEEQDRFIIKYADKGIDWLSKKLIVPREAIRKKVNRLGVNLESVNPHKKYSKEENEFIRDNINKGAQYLAKSLHVSVSAIKNKIRRMGLKSE